MSGGRTLDPEPYVDEDGNRLNYDWGVRAVEDSTHDPRPVIFASTAATPNIATAYSHDPQTCALCWGIIPPEGVTMVPEDGEVCSGHRVHEPNPILVAFRQSGLSASHWLSGIVLGNLDRIHSPNQIAHAHRILTRLAEWKAAS